MADQAGLFGDVVSVYRGPTRLPKEWIEFILNILKWKEANPTKIQWILRIGLFTSICYFPLKKLVVHSHSWLSSIPRKNSSVLHQSDPLDLSPPAKEIDHQICTFQSSDLDFKILNKNFIKLKNRSVIRHSINLSKRTQNYYLAQFFLNFCLNWNKIYQDDPFEHFDHHELPPKFKFPTQVKKIDGKFIETFLKSLISAIPHHLTFFDEDFTSTTRLPVTHVDQKFLRNSIGQIESVSFKTFQINFEGLLRIPDESCTPFNNQHFDTPILKNDSFFKTSPAQIVQSLDNLGAPIKLSNVYNQVQIKREKQSPLKALKLHLSSGALDFQPSSPIQVFHRQPATKVLKCLTNKRPISCLPCTGTLNYQLPTDPIKTTAVTGALNSLPDIKLLLAQVPTVPIRHDQEMVTLKFQPQSQLKYTSTIQKAHKLTLNLTLGDSLLKMFLTPQTHMRKQTLSLNIKIPAQNFFPSLFKFFSTPIQTTATLPTKPAKLSQPACIIHPVPQTPQTLICYSSTSKMGGSLKTQSFTPTQNLNTHLLYCHKKALSMFERHFECLCKNYSESGKMGEKEFENEFEFLKNAALTYYRGTVQIQIQNSHQFPSPRVNPKDCKKTQDELIRLLNLQRKFGLPAKSFPGLLALWEKMSLPLIGFQWIQPPQAAQVILDANDIHVASSARAANLTEFEIELDEFCQKSFLKVRGLNKKLMKNLIGIQRLEKKLIKIENKIENKRSFYFMKNCIDNQKTQIKIEELVGLKVKVQQKLWRKLRERENLQENLEESHVTENTRNSRMDDLKKGPFESIRKEEEAAWTIRMEGEKRMKKFIISNRKEKFGKIFKFFGFNWST